MAMEQEDIENLTSWLQAILKEIQTARGATQEVRDEVKILPEIHNFVSKERGGNDDIDRRVEDLRNHLSNKIDRLEHSVNDLKNSLNDIRNKVNRL